MVEKSELLQVPVFADLPDDQIDWFISQSQEMHSKQAKLTFIRAIPRTAMFVILEGQLQGRGEFGGETVFFQQQGRRYRGRAAFFPDEVLYGKRTRGY